VDQIEKDLNAWNIERVVCVMERGMAGNENRRILQRAGGQYILGEKLRCVHLNQVALSHPGRFKVVKDNLHVKEVFAEQSSGRRRYVIAYRPEQAEVDRVNRNKTPDRLRCELNALNQPERTKSSKAQCNVLLKKSMGRYVKELKSRKLKIDNTKIKQKKNLAVIICFPLVTSIYLQKILLWATSN
jgi:hypothetical protein